MSVRCMAMCISCEHRWLTKFKPETLPAYQQCPKCWSYTVTLVEQWEEHLQHLHGLISPEEAKKFIKLYNFAVEHGYMNNTRSRDIKFRRLLQDLAKQSVNRREGH